MGEKTKVLEQPLVRGALTFGTAAGVCLILGPVLIPILRRLKFGQSVRDDGPKRHLTKAGTPTMGGILFLAGIVTAVLVWAPLNPEVYVLLGITLGYGLIGFIDDFIKVVMRRPLGLRAREKLAGQIVLGLLLGGAAVWGLDRGSALSIPYFGYTVDLSYGYIFFALFWLVGFGNAVNLTDGLDGLAAGSILVTMLAYTFIAYSLDKISLAIFALAVAGGCLGFLVFNRYPALVFMGDTGSLALGGALAGLAVLTQTELLLLIIGGVFVVETLSVIIQVISFQTTGRRVFLMSPLHHHFELAGWSEVKVVRVFWTVAFILAVIGTAIFSL
ncbi:MAG: phospho-N-acetylmuramoyl-pentapeptide-transferase [Syntrophomonadaceae bacterium]|nr:phospho-N-acetylmuramoyl-pentapeptide-transferase [Syntrophomonadaceae bacterium]